MTDKVTLEDVVMILAAEAYDMSGGEKANPSHPFVALMTAAAFAGHIASRKPEEMHKVLDQVMDVAKAAMLEATNNPQTLKVN